MPTDRLDLSVADLPADSKAGAAAFHIPAPPLPTFFECPKCEGLINRENMAEDDCRAIKTYFTYSYCEHCDLAYDLMWTYEDGRWRVPLALKLEGDRARQVIDRIKDLTCA